jgi:hypothetical protein
MGTGIQHRWKYRQFFRLLEGPFGHLPKVCIMPLKNNSTPLSSFPPASPRIRRYNKVLTVLTLRAARMTREHIQTALILEDDVDWDVMIKAQMAEVARGARYLQQQGQAQEYAVSPSYGSPYGDNWWLLVTGHCAITIDTAVDQEHWVIDNDPTVVPTIHRQLFFGADMKPIELQGPHTRVMFGLKRFVCTGSYAISLAGVGKMLYDQQMLPNARPVCLLVFLARPIHMLTLQDRSRAR